MSTVRGPSALKGRRPKAPQHARGSRVGVRPRRPSRRGGDRVTTSSVCTERKPALNTTSYEQVVRSTAIYPDAGTGTTDAIAYAALGLAGETGEIANKFKKVLRGDTPLDEAKAALIDELGDVLWYVTALAAELGTTLDAVQATNATKLLARQERGTLQGSGDHR